MSVEEQVKKIIMEQLGVTAEEVKPEASFVEDLGADSLDLTELIMAMEEAFDVEIADDDAQKILKVQDAISYIERHLLRAEPHELSLVLFEARETRAETAARAGVVPSVPVAPEYSTGRLVIQIIRRSTTFCFMREL